MPDSVYALSIKQPWAALVVHGVKTIEVRRWPTHIRGRILIHAAQVPDERPDGWQRITADLLPTACFRGGIIGAANLMDCIHYEDPRLFFDDEPRHHNAPDWFVPPRMFGFVFAHAELVPFRKMNANVRFFTVPDHSGDTEDG